MLILIGKNYIATDLIYRIELNSTDKYSCELHFVGGTNQNINFHDGQQFLMDFCSRNRINPGRKHYDYNQLASLGYEEQLKSAIQEAELKFEGFMLVLKEQIEARKITVIAPWK